MNALLHKLLTVNYVIALMAIALMGCDTTSGSSGSSIAGWQSNFRATHKGFSGTFYDTLNMDKVSASQNQVTEEDLQKLALTSDLSKAKGFLGLVHSSIYQSQGATNNLVGSDSIVAPLNDIKSRLLAAWDGPSPDIRIFVSSDQTFHGAAYEENFIVLPIGALIDVADVSNKGGGGAEDELAAFMAHELAHILLGHYKRREDSTMTRRLNQTAAGMGVLGVTAKGSRFVKVGDQYQLEVKDEAQTGKAAQNINLINAITMESRRLVTSSASREQEDHADLLAADLLAKAGYSPSKLGDFLERSAVSQEQRAAQISQLTEEQKVLNAELAKTLGAGQGDAIRDVFATTAVAGFQQIMGRAKQSHRSTRKRRENVNGYLERLVLDLYDDGEADNTQTFLSHADVIEGRSTSSTSALDRLRRGSARRTLQIYEKAFEAQALMFHEEEDWRKNAGELLSYALANGGQREAGILAIRADYHKRIGRNDLRIINLTRAVKLDGSAPMMFAQLAEAYLLTHQFDKAIEAIEKGEELTGTKAPFFPLRITYHANVGQFEEAQEVYSECRKVKADGLKRNCNESFAPVQELINEQRKKDMENNPFNDLFNKLNS